MDRVLFKSLYPKNVPIRVRRSSGAIEEGWNILRTRPITGFEWDNSVGTVLVVSQDNDVSKWIFIKEFLELNAVPQDVFVAPIY